VFSTGDGAVGERRGWRALGFDRQPLDRADLIPLPEGATLAMLPDRLAVGQDAAGTTREVSAARGWALAALLPIGYTRTHLPAYAKTPATEPLPFFGYTAVAGIGDQLYAAAVRTDDPHRWLPGAYPLATLQRLVRQRLAAEPENRLLAHHAHCALDYRCPTASNLFFGRWEGATAVSAGCNARCIGCISKQENEDLVSPQDRLMFVPTVDEIVAVGAAHLATAEDAIYSFGQGCEGEPLLQTRVIEAAIRGIRARTDRGLIHINSNASNPRALRRLAAAGLNSLRASTISARRETYDAYYRPIGYTFDDVKRSLILAREAGLATSINLLCFPGLIDDAAEITALVEFLKETGTQLVQLRNLNIDPEVLLPKLPQTVRQPLGMRTLIERLRAEAPAVAIGNFTRPAPALTVDASAAG
jgi:pyruvate-formate lyase-activating enzyme